MQELPKKLQKKLEKRTSENALRLLSEPTQAIDFSSNDYLGFSNNATIFKRASELLKQYQLQQNGATGSRLLSGNHALYAMTETIVASFHQVEAALIFNSGYDANLGFFSCVPQRGDLIFYDELCHASIRDGIAMSHAKSYKFTHNNLSELRSKINKHLPLLDEVNIYVVTESVFSMDGDSPHLKALAQFSTAHGFRLVVDEAHAIGVLGDQGEGLVQQLGIEHKVFARIVTFGKALGCHGAAVLGSQALKTYLVNFARSLIYTTALSPHAIATILAAYEYLQSTTTEIIELHRNIAIFKNEIARTHFSNHFIPSNTAIQCGVFAGNDRIKHITNTLQNNKFDVKPILSPTVPIGEERLRICLHSFNTEKDIIKLTHLLKDLI